MSSVYFSKEPKGRPVARICGLKPYSRENTLIGSPPAEGIVSTTYKAATMPPEEYACIGSTTKRTYAVSDTSIIST